MRHLKAIAAISLLIGAAVAVADEPGADKKEADSKFPSRKGAAREKFMREGGATGASETAVAKGLMWVSRVQHKDGYWKLDGEFPDKGNANDAAATGLALLPFLGAGRTHLPAKDNVYDKEIKRGIDYLIGIQNKDTGAFNKDSYAHGLCTIAICEAFGMTQDEKLKEPAQLAIDYIVAAQHDGGGWRYVPGQMGDTSVSGWQMMALKTGQIAGLNIPHVTFRRARNFLENQTLHQMTEGYGYIDGDNPTSTMTAVALLCRIHVQGWGPLNKRLQKSVEQYLKPNFPKAELRNAYYYYYATQVMYQIGGDDWRAWNMKIREQIVKSQFDDRTKPEEWGSWSPAGDQWGKVGGRLMITSLNLLTLEAYYRHAPYRMLPDRGIDQFIPRQGLDRRD